MTAPTLCCRCCRLLASKMCHHREIEMREMNFIGTQLPVEVCYWCSIDLVLFATFTLKFKTGVLKHIHCGEPTRKAQILGVGKEKADRKRVIKREWWPSGSGQTPTESDDHISVCVCVSPLQWKVMTTAVCLTSTPQESSPHPPLPPPNPLPSPCSPSSSLCSFS